MQAKFFLKTRFYFLLGICAFFIAVAVSLYVYMGIGFDGNDYRPESKGLFGLAVGTLISIAAMFLGIHFSGATIKDYFNFAQDGILGMEPVGDFRKREENDKYKKLIESARREIILCGTTLSGWFEEPSFVAAFLDRLEQGVKITLIFVDPASSNFRDRQKAEKMGKDVPTGKRASKAFERLLVDFDKLEFYLQTGKLQILVHRLEPFAIEIFDDRAFWRTYLPFTANKNSPSLRMMRGGKFSNVVCDVVAVELLNQCQIPDSPYGRSIKDRAGLEELRNSSIAMHSGGDS
jgi:hypothetical protein